MIEESILLVLFFLFSFGSIACDCRAGGGDGVVVRCSADVAADGGHDALPRTRGGHQPPFCGFSVATGKLLV